MAFARQQVLREPDRKKLEQGGEFETAGGRRAKWGVENRGDDHAGCLRGGVHLRDFRADASGTRQSRATLYGAPPTWSIDAGEQGKLKAEVKKRIAELQVKKS